MDKTIELSGTILYETHEWYKIKLVQEDGYKIDLISRFMEAKESYPGSKFQINYWVSDKPYSKDSMIEAHLRKIYGSVNAEYEKNEVRYSSWTSDVDYDSTLKIGGHDLYKELSESKGKFLIIEINIK